MVATENLASAQFKTEGYREEVCTYGHEYQMQQQKALLNGAALTVIDL